DAAGDPGAVGTRAALRGGLDRRRAGRSGPLPGAGDAARPDPPVGGGPTDRPDALHDADWDPAMHTHLTAGPAPRRPPRPLLAGAVVVALAIAGLALLSEAFANGGQAVYLAHISASATLVPVAPSLVVTGSGRATAPADGAVLQLLLVRPGTDLTSGLTANPIDAVVHDIRAAGVVETAIVLVTIPAPSYVCSAEAGCSAVRIEVSIDHPDLKRLN